MVLRRFMKSVSPRLALLNLPIRASSQPGRAASAEMATGLFAEDDSPVRRNLARRGPSGNVRKVAGASPIRGVALAHFFGYCRPKDAPPRRTTKYCKDLEDAGLF